MIVHVVVVTDEGTGAESVRGIYSTRDGAVRKALGEMRALDPCDMDVWVEVRRYGVDPEPPSSGLLTMDPCAGVVG